MPACLTAGHPDVQVVLQGAQPPMPQDMPEDYELLMQR